MVHSLIVHRQSRSIGTSRVPPSTKVENVDRSLNSRIGKELGIDPNVVLQSSHGRRSIDTLKLYDPSKANWECSFESLPVSQATPH